MIYHSIIANVTAIALACPMNTTSMNSSIADDEQRVTVEAIEGQTRR